MTKILMWDKPKKARSKEQWAEHAGFDGGPPGGYVPNMSEDDEQRWKAKIVGTKTGYPQVEIRKKAGPSLMTIIVNLGGGYNYKYYTANGRYHGKTPADFSSNYMKDQSEIDRYALMDTSTLGINIHLSMNGPSQMTFEDMANMQLAIQEAREVLSAMEAVPGDRGNYVAVLNNTDFDGSEQSLSKIPGVKVQHRFRDGGTNGAMIGFSAPLDHPETFAAIDALQMFDKIMTRTEASELARQEWEAQWDS